MKINPSLRVPRSHRVYFEGSPESGCIEVRCASEQNFTLLKTPSGWVVTIGDSFCRSVYLKIRPQLEPFSAYNRAVHLLWRVDPQTNVWGLPEALL